MLTTAHVYTTLLIHLGVILVVTAYYTVGSAILPRLTERSHERFARRPWMAILVGVLISAPWAAGSLVLLNLQFGPAKFLGAVIGCLWILTGLFGGAAIARHVGRAAGGDWRATARGGLFLALTWVLPLIGWFLMLPMTLATGVGCFALGLAPARPVAPPLAA